MSIKHEKCRDCRYVDGVCNNEWDSAICDIINSILKELDKEIIDKIRKGCDE